MIMVQSARADAPAWSMDALSLHVKPMKNRAVESRDYIQVWELPNDFSFKHTGPNAELTGHISSLASRGIAATAHMRYSQSWLYNETGVLAVASELQVQGIPVNIMAWLPNTVADIGPMDYFWKGDIATNWVTDPANTNYMHFVYETGGSECRIPIYPLADSLAAREYIKSNLQFLKNGGITDIDGLWQDYETMPHAWNGTYAAQQLSSARVFYQQSEIEDVLDTHTAYFEYSVSLKRRLMDEALGAALREVYGTEVPYGNYDPGYSTVAHPYIGTTGTHYPPIEEPASRPWATPPIYAASGRLIQFFTSSEDITVSRSKVDDIYWFQMLRAFSSSVINNGVHGETLPYICSLVANVASNNAIGADPLIWNNPVNTRMSRDVYRELLRHFWLRGAVGMHVFTHVGQNPALGIDRTPLQQFEEIEDARLVLDEMLNYRSFLDDGIAMNYLFSSTYTGLDNDRTWSGLKNGNEALVRVSDRSGSGYIFSIPVTSWGHTFMLKSPADRSGAMYIIKSDGSAECIESANYQAYLSFDGDLLDETGNGHNGTIANNTSEPLPDPGYINISTQQLILGSQNGFIINKDNSSCIELKRSPTSVFRGTGIIIENANNAFDADSFTAELFVSVGPGNDVDVNGNLFSKKDSWQVRLRPDGALEVGVYYGTNNSNAWFRTAANVLPHDDGIFHHLAYVYDAGSRQMKLFVDYEAVIWQYWRTGVGVDGTGILPESIDQSDHGDILLGRAPVTRAMNGFVDEFRFTPDVLEPGQFIQRVEITNADRNEGMLIILGRVGSGIGMDHG